MTAADKLRELLASRPAMPSLEELTRWWRTTAELLPVVLAQLDVATNLDTRDAEVIELRRLLEIAVAKWVSLSGNRTWGATEAEERALCAKALGPDAMARITAGFAYAGPARKA